MLTMERPCHFGILEPGHYRMPARIGSKRQAPKIQTKRFIQVLAVAYRGGMGLKFIAIYKVLSVGNRLCAACTARIPAI